jgi:FkbM family methyltransferase
MNRAFVRIARRIYKATPFPAVRHVYFTAFCRAMRGRRTRATIGGSTFDLDLGEMIDVALYLEQYELDVTAALHRYARSGMVVFDIGANIGAHTLTLGRLTGPTGRVYAFEPTAFAFAKLTRNVSLNDAPHVQPVQVALSDVNRPGQTIAYRSSWTTAGGRSDSENVVDFVRLDDWCRENGVDRVGLVKMDVDGNEYGALAGGAEILARCRPVIVMEAVWPHFADPARNPFTMLERLGYRFSDAKTDRPYTVDEMSRLFPEGDRGMTISINVIARPEGTTA